ncbi:MAG: hypothetical protein ABIF09_12825 [Gemmatimonadota bacterium]
MSEDKVRIRLLFADSGAFHHEDMNVPASSVQGHDRLIDGLQEDQELLRGIYLDMGRLCGAWLVDEED